MLPSVALCWSMISVSHRGSITCLRVFRPTLGDEHGRLDSFRHQRQWPRGPLVPGPVVPASSACSARRGRKLAGIFGRVAPHIQASWSAAAPYQSGKARAACYRCCLAPPRCRVSGLFLKFSVRTRGTQDNQFFGAVGQGTEIVAAIVMEKQASVVPRVGRPFKSGFSGFLWRTAAVLTAAHWPWRSSQSEPQTAHGGRRHGHSRVALMRMSIEKDLGTASAGPACFVHQQRLAMAPLK